MSLCLYKIVEVRLFTMKGRGSVVEQSLSNYKVMGSTPLSGSILFELVIISVTKMWKRLKSSSKS